MKHMFSTRLCAALVLAAGLAAGVPAFSAAQDAAETVERIEDYLGSLRTIESDFIQSSSNGDFARGRLYVERPDSMRLDYQPPSTLQIYVNGSWLIYIDTELEEVTHVPLSRTPAAFLVGDKVSLSDEVQVAGIGMDAETIRVELVRSEDPEAGSVILTFGRNPLVLRNWVVIDPKGVRTRVALVRPSFNRSIDRSVFDFDPDRYIRPQTDQ
ncbi:MAG: outer membrane lipoprotein carrier protein LolA [Defluviicoccus sp.]|nr:outer membrane lipoprotein carrier protein LolA [Defluviicoccus sp.]